MEDIEFWIYENNVKNKMENLQRAYFFELGASTPLLSTAYSLRFLSPSDAGFLDTETPEEIHRRAQQQYEYLNSPPPSNMKGYIQYFKQEKEKNRKNKNRI